MKNHSIQALFFTAFMYWLKTLHFSYWIRFVHTYQIHMCPQICISDSLALSPSPHSIDSLNSSTLSSVATTTPKSFSAMSITTEVKFQSLSSWVPLTGPFMPQALAGLPLFGLWGIIGPHSFFGNQKWQPWLCYRCKLTSWTALLLWPGNGICAFGQRERSSTMPHSFRVSSKDSIWLLGVHFELKIQTPRSRSCWHSILYFNETFKIQMYFTDKGGGKCRQTSYFVSQLFDTLKHLTHTHIYNKATHTYCTHL